MNSTMPDAFSPPYAYDVYAANFLPETMTVRLSNCPAPDNGMDVPLLSIPAPIDTRTTGQQSPDGVAYAGSTSSTLLGVTITQSWNFTGTE